MLGTESRGIASDAARAAIARRGWKAVAVALAALGLLAAAKPAPTPKIGIVDTQRIAAESRAIRDLIGDAAKKADALRDEAKKLQAELAARLDAYAAQSGVVTKEEEKRRYDAVEKLKEDLDVLEFRLGREVKKSQAGTVGPMGTKILDAIKAVSAEQGLTVILTTQDVVHFDAAHEITAAVIAKLDG